MIFRKITNYAENCGNLVSVYTRGEFQKYAGSSKILYAVERRKLACPELVQAYN